MGCSTSASTRQPCAVLVALIRLTITSWLTKGFPLQFMLIKENNRCSILFHLLVLRPALKTRPERQGCQVTGGGTAKTSLRGDRGFHVFVFGLQRLRFTSNI